LLYQQLRDAEFVAFRVLHNGPPDSPLVLVSNLGCTERDQPSDIGISISAVKIYMHTILGDFSFGDFDEEERWLNVSLWTTNRHEEWGRTLIDRAGQRCGPKGSQRNGIIAVNGYVLKRQGHDLLL
jgi:hypothetical protein